MAVDSASVSRWFDDYVEVFAAAVRGERPVSELLDCYAVPLTLTTDEGAVSLSTRDQLAAVIQGQVMACAGVQPQFTAPVVSQSL